MDRLPEPVLIDCLVRSQATSKSYGGPFDEVATRRLGRLASLARFLAQPARVASLHTVVPSSELLAQLQSDPSIARHIRLIRLDFQYEACGYATDDGEGEEAALELARWRRDVEVVLTLARAATRLVLNACSG